LEGEIGEEIGLRLGIAVIDDPDRNVMHWTKSDATGR
jgi:hypothetical protein